MSSISLNDLSQSYVPITSLQQKRNVDSHRPSVPVSDVFKNHAPKSKPSACRILKKIAFEIINERNMAIINAIYGEARAVYGMVKIFFKNLIHVAKLFAISELSKFFSIPFDVFNVAMGAYSFIVEKGQGRIDAFLGILGGLSEIGDAVSSIATVLVDIGAAGASTLAWATPLNLASCALSAVFILMNVRSLYFTGKVLKNLNQSLKKPAVPDYRGAYNVLKKHTYALERHCSVDIRLVQSKVRHLFKEKHAAKTRVGRKAVEAKLEAVYKKMKLRIYQKQFSLALGIVITKLGMLATATFALSPFFSPLAIVGFSSLAILFAACLFKMGFDFYANARFRQSIKAIPAA